MQHANCQSTVIHKAYNTALTRSVQTNSEFTVKTPHAIFLNLVLQFRDTDYSDNLPLLCFSTTAKIRSSQFLARYTYCFCTCVVCDNFTTIDWRVYLRRYKFFFPVVNSTVSKGTRLFNTV
jgi:hypothetical protein